MSWTAPMTAVANDIFTAAQFNTHVRDNLLETAPGKATAGVADGSYFVKSGTNSIIDRTPTSAFQSAGGTRATTSFGALTGGGTNPAVTVTTGTKALVNARCHVNSATVSNIAAISFAISGATTSASTFDRAGQLDGVDASGKCTISCLSLVSLTAGSNTFTLEYWSQNTATFELREITVIPF